MIHLLSLKSVLCKYTYYFPALFVALESQIYSFISSKSVYDSKTVYKFSVQYTQRRNADITYHFLSALQPADVIIGPQQNFLCYKIGD